MNDDDRILMYLSDQTPVRVGDRLRVTDWYEGRYRDNYIGQVVTVKGTVTDDGSYKIRVKYDDGRKGAWLTQTVHMYCELVASADDDYQWVVDDAIYKATSTIDSDYSISRRVTSYFTDNPYPCRLKSAFVFMSRIVEDSRSIDGDCEARLIEYGAFNLFIEELVRTYGTNVNIENGLNVEWQTRELLKDAKELCEAVDNLVNQPTKEDTTMSEVIGVVEVKTFIDGVDGSTLTDEQIYAKIKKIESVISGYESIGAKPQKLAAKIASLNENIAALVAYIDARTP